MTLVPVVCESCELVWGDERLIDADGATDLRISNVQVGPCPKCGGFGRVPDGVYDVRDDTLQVVGSSDIPADTLQGLIATLESLRDGEASAEDVIDKAEAEAPELVPFIREMLAKGDSKFWLSALIAVLLWSVPSPLASRPPTAEEIANELRADNIPGLARPPAAQ